MITLTKNGNAIVFTFEDNAHYLFDGTIEVPVNSLTLITDNSQMATFKKSASNDVFISATYAELGMSKSELESWFKENACGSTGGGGVTSGEVETMIETSLEDYYDIDEVDAALAAKANTATTYSKTDVDTALAAKANTATTYSKTEVDNAITAATSTKQDTLIAGSGITISGNVISATGGGVTVDPSLNSGSTNPVANSAITQAINDVKAYYVDFGILTTQGIHDADWDGLVNAINACRPIYAGLPGANGLLYYTAECLYQDGSNTIRMTASDNSAHFFYTFIKNGSENYSFSSDTRPYTTQAEKTAWNAKQDALVSGTNIKTINNESILGSGNITISGGGGSYVYYTEDTENKTATIDVQTDDGLGNRSENSVFVDGSSILIESTNDTNDGEGNTANTDTQIVINGLGFSIIADSDDGTDFNETQLEVQPMGAYINSEPIATEPYVNDALSGKADTSAVTAISNSLSGYVQTSAVTTSVTSGSTDSEIPTAKATYDAIQAGGGGATYSAGTNISIDSANTINCTLPIETISNSYGTRQIYVGDNIHKNNNYGAIVIANKDNSSTGETRVEFAEGAISIGSTNKVFHNGIAIGYNATAGAQNVWSCIAIGYNVAATGTTKMNLNNQIKVDANNQVYIKDKTNTTDVCIQDAIAALGGLKLVKLTQAQYDALATKDANTLYIISNVVS